MIILEVREVGGVSREERAVDNFENEAGQQVRPQVEL
jgi:hypothetical protein